MMLGDADCFAALAMTNPPVIARERSDRSNLSNPSLRGSEATEAICIWIADCFVSVMHFAKMNNTISLLAMTSGLLASSQ